MKKSMWKKGMAAVFAAALAVGTLAGCGGGSNRQMQD